MNGYLRGMKDTLISNIYANLPTLDTVLDDFLRR